MAENPNADIIQQLLDNNKQLNKTLDSEIDLLKSIDQNLSALRMNPNGISQSNAMHQVGNRRPDVDGIPRGLNTNRRNQFDLTNRMGMTNAARVFAQAFSAANRNNINSRITPNQNTTLGRLGLNYNDVMTAAGTGLANRFAGNPINTLIANHQNKQIERQNTAFERAFNDGARRSQAKLQELDELNARYLNEGEGALSNRELRRLRKLGSQKENLEKGSHTLDEYQAFEAERKEYERGQAQHQSRIDSYGSQIAQKEEAIRQLEAGANAALDVMNVRIIEVASSTGWYMPVQDVSGITGFDEAAVVTQDQIDESEKSRLLGEVDSLRSLQDLEKSAMNSETEEINKKAAGLGLLGKGEGGLDVISSLGEKLNGALGGVPQMAQMGIQSVMGLISGGIDPVSLAFRALMIVITLLIDLFGDLIEANIQAMNRSAESLEKNAKLAAERMEKDVKTLVEQPFTILKDAANSVTKAFEDQLNIIGQTQGYNKSDLQDLMAVYAERLRNENLTSVVSGASIIESLTSVLKTGLSGAIAEEFAYTATKLNAAVPTQDFFSYASTYASIASEAMLRGLNQNQAIQEANKQLEQFASNILYTSRQLTGGFSTGLSNAQSLLDSAFQIAQTSKTGDVNTIAGVLTSVQGIIGAIAPDVQSNVVQSIIDTAMGGNNSNFVALRSLAGVNASNTEFLRLLATDPQSLFVKMFQGLGQLQQLSSDAYMERAEGLSSIFGLSLASLSRIDFNYLADKIAEMNVNSDSLQSNLDLLISGETTTNAEQQRIQQINKFMIEEGLAYVLDNEAARAIQEHMWDEQIARELMETEYAVNLDKASKETFAKILGFVEALANFFTRGTSAAQEQLQKTQEDIVNLEKDIKQVLELGKVGEGNSQEFYQLTTRDVKHNLIDPLVELFGGTSNYVSGGRMSEVDMMMNGLMAAASNSYQPYFADMMDSATTMLSNSVLNSVSAGIQVSSPNSKYAWGDLVSKANNQLVTSLMEDVPRTIAASTTSVVNKSKSFGEVSIEKLNKMLDQEYIRTFTDYDEVTHRMKGTYDDWKNSMSKFGLTNEGFDTALRESETSEQQIRAMFMSAQAKSEAEEQLRKSDKEELYWDESFIFYDDSRLFYDDSRLFYDDSRQFYETTVEWENALLNTVKYGLLQESGAEGVSGIPYLDLIRTNQEEKIIPRQDISNEHFYKYRQAWESYYLKQSMYRSSFDNLNADLSMWSPFGSVKDALEGQITTVLGSSNNWQYWTQEQINSLKQAEETMGEEARIYALADTLTKSLTQNSDPVAQTNALLSQILVVVNAIMQQNNKVGGMALPDALSGLAMGITSETE